MRNVLLALAATSGLLCGSPFVTQAAEPPQKAQKPTLALSSVMLGARVSELTALHGKPTALVLSPDDTDGLSKLQTPPETVALFNSKQLPDWAAAITPPLDAEQALWLYRRDTYSLGFQVNAQGVVDAILLAGVSPSKSALTQLQSSRGTLLLGDDYRKMTTYFGHPDKIANTANPKTLSRSIIVSYKAQDSLPGDVTFTIRNDRVARITLKSTAP